LKAIAEFVENSIDAHAKTITITRGKEHNAHYWPILEVSKHTASAFGVLALNASDFAGLPGLRVVTLSAVPRLTVAFATARAARAAPPLHRP
jgi:hypothetical protein